MAKIACLVTDMFEDVEYTKPAGAFKDEGHTVVTIERESGKTVEGKQGEAKVTIDEGINNVNPGDFDALFLPGGFSPDQLRADERFVQFAESCMKSDKPVLAICHGPQLLLTAKTLEGRTATGFKSIKVDMEYAGADYKDEEVVVCKDQLVTSRNPDDIPAFVRESLKLLNKVS
ncbi:type 1 glutamine amidotransferase domain-containing protein [Bacillus sp. AK031]